MAITRSDLGAERLLRLIITSRLLLPLPPFRNAERDAQDPQHNQEGREPLQPERHLCITVEIANSNEIMETRIDNTRSWLLTRAAWVDASNSMAL